MGQERNRIFGAVSLSVLLGLLTTYNMKQTPFTPAADASVAVHDANATDPQPNLSFTNINWNDWYEYTLGTKAFVPSAPGSARLAKFYAANDWKNDIVLDNLGLGYVRNYLPRTLQIWFRNFVAGSLLYYIAGFAWVLVIYKMYGSHFFSSEGEMPTWEDQKKQIWVSQKALVLYTFMPTLGEWAMERGFTKAYYDISDYGWDLFIVNHTLYLIFIEFGIYWIHRGLHYKFLYRWLHADHHKYNKENTLSPFAGLAFHPLDGMAQASPYLAGLFLVPVHFWTHTIMLFFTAVWTTNIHDALVGNTEPVMGSGYHTIHHTTYRHNYGQFFIFFDWLFGTLYEPKISKGSSKAKLK